MPKVKTRRGIAKRLRRTGTGLLRRGRAYRRHILTKMSRKRKRRLRKPALVSPVDEKRMNRNVPYL